MLTDMAKKSMQKSKIVSRQTLLKADSVTVTFTRELDGKIRVNCTSFEVPAVILPGEVFQAEWKDRQVHLVRVS